MLQYLVVDIVIVISIYITIFFNFVLVCVFYISLISTYKNINICIVRYTQKIFYIRIIYCEKSSSTIKIIISFNKYFFERRGMGSVYLKYLIKFFVRRDFGIYNE